MKITLKSAKKSDSKDIIKLITELAKFEKLAPPDKKSQARLLRHAFGKNPYFRILLAFDGDKAIGYAFYFFTYSTFLSKRTLYLEDIFINEKYRKYGAGSLLFDKLIKIARRNGCGRIEFVVLDWNKNAMKFYDKYGAKHMKEWCFYRLTL